MVSVASISSFAQEIFTAIDKIIVSYIGLSSEKDSLRALQVENTGGDIVIRGTRTNKRHMMVDNISSFLDENSDEMNKKQKDQLGQAVGKSIAPDLTISFNESKVIND